LPSSLASASKGRFQSELPPSDEGRRDFARIFFADDPRIYVVAPGMPSMRPLQPTAAPSSAHVGDLSEKVAERAEALFTESLTTHLTQACGGEAPDPATVERLRKRATAAMTVNVGIDFALHMKLMPTFLQPFFLIIIMPDMKEARAATFGFVADSPQHIVGDRPESKRTPFCVRLLSPNLLAPQEKQEEMERCWEVDYSIQGVSTSTIKQAVENEMQLVRKAIVTDSWTPLS
jgi:hypothetical protein